MEGQKWEIDENEDFFVFENPNSGRFLTALSTDKDPALTITGTTISRCNHPFSKAYSKS